MWKLEEIRTIFPGQIMKRILGTKTVERLKIETLPPGAIHAGFYDEDKTLTEYVESEHSLEKLEYYHKVAQPDDIIIKLASPFESTVIRDLKQEWLVIPHYCAILRSDGSTLMQKIPTDYLCAVLNSRFVKEQFERVMSGVKNPMLKIGDLASVHIPEKPKDAMEVIGTAFSDLALNKKAYAELIDKEERIIDFLVAKEYTEPEGYL